MRRPLWLRLLLGLWAVWFNAALLEAPGIHTCAVHSGAAAGVHSHASAPAQMHSHAAHAASPTAPSKDTGTCTCLGNCCGVTAFVPGDSAPNIVAHYAAIAPRRIGNAVVAPTVDRPYARPFANGPPSVV